MSIFEDPDYKGGPDHWPQNQRDPQMGDIPPLPEGLPSPMVVALELQAIGPATVAEVSMGGFAVLTILAALQLALLHPSYQVPSTARTTTEGLARYLQSCLSPYPAPNRTQRPARGRDRDAGTEPAPGHGVKSDVADRFLNGLTLETRQMIEREAQERMPASLRERLEAYYAAGKVPGHITVAALDAARREVVAERLQATQEGGDPPCPSSTGS